MDTAPFGCRTLIVVHRKVTPDGRAGTAGVSQARRSVQRMTRTNMVLPRQIPYPEAGLPHCPHCETPIDTCANAECNEALSANDFETWSEGNMSCWVEREFARNWTVAYRIVVEEGRNVVGEMRIFPHSSNNVRAGEWHDGELHGIAAVVPDGGITASMLREVSPTYDNDLFGAIAIAHQYRDDAHPTKFDVLESGDIMFETLDRNGPVSCELTFNPT